jgi:hypothetical protein
VLRGGFHDEAAHLGAAGKEDVVERVVQERLGNLFPAGEEGHLALLKQVGEEPLEDGVRVRGLFGRLQHYAVARGEGAHDGPEGEREGVVPG